MTLATMLLDFVRPNERKQARAELRAVLVERDTATRAHEDAQARLAHAEQVEKDAETEIGVGLEAARSAREARESRLVESLASGLQSAESDAELAARQRAALDSVSGARLRKRAAEQAIPALIDAEKQAAQALRSAEERVEQSIKRVISLHIERTTAERLDSLAQEYSTLAKWRAASCELGAMVGPPPRVQLQFGRPQIQDELAALQQWRLKLRSDAEAGFEFP